MTGAHPVTVAPLVNLRDRHFIFGMHIKLILNYLDFDLFAGISFFGLDCPQGYSILQNILLNLISAKPSISPDSMEVLVKFKYMYI